jgi:hypothetical protein
MSWRPSASVTPTAAWRFEMAPALDRSDRARGVLGRAVERLLLRRDGMRSNVSAVVLDDDQLER